MKRTILRRTEITIESLQITTIRSTRVAEVSDAPAGESGTRLAEHQELGHIPTRMERAKQLLRRKINDEAR